MIVQYGRESLSRMVEIESVIELSHYTISLSGVALYFWVDYKFGFVGSSSGVRMVRFCVLCYDVI